MASNPRTMTNLEAREKEQRSVCVFTDGCTESRMATALLDRFFQVVCSPKIGPVLMRK